MCNTQAGRPFEAGKCASNKCGNKKDEMSEVPVWGRFHLNSLYKANINTTPTREKRFAGFRSLFYDVSSSSPQAVVQRT